MITKEKPELSLEPFVKGTLEYKVQEFSKKVNRINKQVSKDFMKNIKNLSNLLKN